MNSVLSRASGRRGGRRPGWTLMTVLLALAIAASSALVFTNRVELLKLAVIIALWAAVAAAFVSVIYRRQSDVDQARARDLKLVYDLQLDREISARREYELTVESQLRSEMASELKAQAADEVAALRAELSALRTNLEIIFDSDLSHRPALETERTTLRAYSDRGPMSGENPAIPRPTPAASRRYPHDDAVSRTEDAIIDVPEVRIATGGIPVPPWKPEIAESGSERRGSHRRGAGEPAAPPRRAPDDVAKPAPAAARWGQPPQPFIAPQPRREPEPAPAAPPLRPTFTAPAAPSTVWEPVSADGEWLPPGTPGSHWSADISGAGRRGATESAGKHAGTDSPVAAGSAPETAAPSKHGRHSGAPDLPDDPRKPDEPGRARSRHAPGSPDDGGWPPSPPPAFTPPTVTSPTSRPAPAPRHATGDDASTPSSNTGGQSVADLMARLHSGRPEGGRRRKPD